MVPAPPFEDLLAQLDEAKVLRSNRCVRCGAGQYCRRGGRRKLEAMGLATHQVVGKIPNVAVPAADQRQICGAAPTTAWPR
jgi:hypothetical protein